MSGLIWSGVAAVAVVMFIGSSQRRRTRRLSAGRPGGIVGFANSMGRDPADQVARAVYNALIKVGGRDLATVEGGDDLGSWYGIVDEDVDDLVLDAARHVDGVGEQALTGTHVDLKTPCEVVEFLEGLKRSATRR